MLLICIITSFICIFVDSINNIAKPQFYDNIFDVSDINLEALSQLKSVPILDNKDPGRNPSSDCFGVLGTLVYPMKELDISENDKMLIVIRPSDAIKNDKVDAYISYDTKKIQQSKSDFCFFKTAKATTPLFYISIYKNDIAIIKDVGIFAAHLSQLKNEFKPYLKHQYSIK